ncbi:MAG: exopolysaccharide biosynthesis polyprenyl glycosylphosphotransferase [Eubacteriales bacterium]|nr:exopolysaccharide biosynthesis polyprenyl glycosylphosphotransferase [Eubacteriales bacterium]
MEKKEIRENSVWHMLQIRTIKLLNVALISGAFAGCWFGYYAYQAVSPYYDKGNFLVVILFALLYVLFSRVYNGFLISINRISELCYSQALSAMLADSIMFVITILLVKRVPNVLPICLAAAVQMLLILSWSFLASQWYTRKYAPKKTVILYGENHHLDMLIQSHRLDRRFDVMYSLDVNACLKNRNLLSDAEVVFISGVQNTDQAEIIRYCLENHVELYLLPNIYDVILRGGRQLNIMHLPMVYVNRFNPSPEYQLIKRFMDMLLSFAALIVLSPLLLLTAVAIKACDGGPILYKQKRLTQGGREFYVLKFRSMRVDAEKNGVAQLSTGIKDDRITPVGRIIRKTRIDELPQLINIIRGDMSIVGPRPERPELTEQFEKELPEFSLRLQAKAGLTGYAQVYGKYNTTPYDKLQMDLTYIAKASIIEDVRIMLATVRILFDSESTEGFEEKDAQVLAGKIVENGKRREAGFPPECAGDIVKEQSTSAG